MDSTSCPHCGAAVVVGGAFCESCGKALPQAGAGGPRVIAESAFATTSAGVALQADELRKQLGRASGALVLAAVVQTIFGFVEYVILSQDRQIPVARMHAAVAVIFGIAVIFWGLFIWSRKSPLPAAIVGLVLYVSLWMLDMIVALKNIQSHPNGLLNGIIIKVIVTAALIRAVGAGVKYRQIIRRQGQP